MILPLYAPFAGAFGPRLSNVPTLLSHDRKGVISASAQHHTVEGLVVMRTADGDPDLEPKRVPYRPVFRQEVFLILQDHSVVVEMIADLRPERQVASAVPAKICQSVL